MKKKILLGALGAVFVATAALTVIKTVDSWVVRSTRDDVRSAIEIHPTKGRKPLVDALAELVWYRKEFNAGCYERMNISAMNDNEPMYRIGVERGNCPEDEHRPIVFCMERPEIERGLPAHCPLIIDADGKSVHVTGKLYINGVEIEP
jgi:hypothetical protein